MTDIQDSRCCTSTNVLYHSGRLAYRARRGDTRLTNDVEPRSGKYELRGWEESEVAWKITRGQAAMDRVLTHTTRYHHLPGRLEVRNEW